MGENGVVPSFLTYNVSLGGWELICKLWERMSDEEDLPLRNAAFAWVILCVEKGFFKEVFRIVEDMSQGNVSKELVYG